VLEANVYGVEIPNHDGRPGCAAILSQTSPSPGLMDDLAIHAREKKLPKFAVPTFLRVVKTVTATGNNKQQKAELRNEGVQPSKVGDERFYWLRSKGYVPFDESACMTVQGWRPQR